MAHVVELVVEGDVGVIRIDSPPLNVLNRRMIRELAQAVDAAAANPRLIGLVICCANRSFIVGADLSEFDDPGFETTAYNGTLAKLERFDRPVVAAIHGMAYGGGLELTLACHYRVATEGSRLALPEVLIGVLPGSLGTQRLPRLVPVEMALEMMLTGKPVSAVAAQEAGLVDAIVAGPAKDAGIRFLRDLRARGEGPRPTCDRTVAATHLPADFFDKAFADVTARRAAYPASRAIVRCVEAATTANFAEGERIEARLFDECRLSRQSRALRHLFFAEREARKVPGLPADIPMRPIRKVGIVGAGTMGGGIAMNFANAGIQTVIVDATPEALERGLAIVQRNYEASAARGRLKESQVKERLALLAGSLDYGDLASCDLVIEAVFEDLQIKKQALARLGRVCKAEAIIASNTSTLDVDVLAEASGRPTSVLGMHFFSPANVMRLLEVVRGARTAPDVLATVLDLARKIGKTAVVSGVCFGFIGNRMAEPYLREAEFLLMEGVSPPEVDAAVEDSARIGLAMGPCRMLDLAGVDVAAKTVIENEKAGGLSSDPSYRRMTRGLFERGRLGQKTGQGYYRYEGRQFMVSPETATLAEELARQHGIVRRASVNPGEIVERLLYPMINEGTKILEEGIAYRVGDIDVVWTAGYGFPDHRGGPMFMAQEIGYDTILDRLEHYGRVCGNEFGYWTPSSLLRQLAEKSPKRP